MSSTVSLHLPKTESQEIPHPLSGAPAADGLIKRSTSPSSPLSPRRRPFRWLTAFLVPAALVAVVGALLTYQPAFYQERLESSDAEQARTLSKQFLKEGTRLLNDINNGRSWKAVFREQQINAWLAGDFEINHAEQSLPAGVTRPRVSIES